MVDNVKNNVRDDFNYFLKSITLAYLNQNIKLIKLFKSKID